MAQYIRRALPVVCLLLASSAMTLTLAQTSLSTEPQAAQSAQPAESPNFNITLHLILASNDAAVKTNLPSSLEGVSKQLRASLAFANFRVVATLLGRTRQDKGYQIQGVANAMFPVPSSASNPVFYDWRIRNIHHIGREGAIDVAGFVFNVRMPIVVGTVEAGKSQIQYENAGIFSDLSVTENEPVVVGAVNIGRVDEMFVVVATVQRPR